MNRKASMQLPQCKLILSSHYNTCVIGMYFIYTVPACLHTRKIVNNNKVTDRRASRGFPQCKLILSSHFIMTILELTLHIIIVMSTLNYAHRLMKTEDAHGLMKTEDWVLACAC